ncbi:hypothetical protein BDD12DRAFT_900202 [Trichophaea hybrida]|nr:hypothetical protein BDD12DRAFT_900202 [Trichophaea hybrida]
MCTRCAPTGAEISRQSGYHLVAADKDDELLQLLRRMHLGGIQDMTNRPPLLYRAYDGSSRDQWNAKTGFTAPNYQCDVDGYEHWNHLTSPTERYHTPMITPSESRDWIRHWCVRRINGGKPDGYVLEIETKDIRTPIPKALTKVFRLVTGSVGKAEIL